MRITLLSLIHQPQLNWSGHISPVQLHLWIVSLHGSDPLLQFFNQVAISRLLFHINSFGDWSVLLNSLDDPQLGILIFFLDDFIGFLSFYIKRIIISLSLFLYFWSRLEKQKPGFAILRSNRNWHAGRFFHNLRWSLFLLLLNLSLNRTAALLVVWKRISWVPG